MKKHTLKAEKRTLAGRKVKTLRAKGLLPATLYGKHVKSESLSVGLEDFQKVYEQARETGLVELTGAGEGSKPVLIHTVQRHPVTQIPLHAEFFQVDLKEKVKTRVPIVLVGEAPAVHEKLGVLLTVADEVEVEALPTNLPEHIELDVSSLAQVNAELHVSDIHAPEGVAILTDRGQTIVKVAALVSKEAEAQAAAEAAAAAAAAATVAPVAAGAGEGEAGAPKAEEPAKPEAAPAAGKPTENQPAQTEKKQ